MKKLSFLFSVPLILMTLASCGTKSGQIAMDEKSYNKALKENTVEAYAAFLTEYPDSKYAEDIAYNMALQEGTVERLCWYLTRYKDAPEFRAEQVRDTIIKLLSNETYDSIRKVQTNVSDNLLKTDIYNLLWSREEYAWQIACSENSITSYEKYIHSYPKGDHLKQIQKKEAFLSEQKCNDLMDVAIRAYLESENKRPRYGRNYRKKMETPEVIKPTFSNPELETSYLELKNAGASACTVYLRAKSSKVQTIYMKAHSTYENDIANGSYDLVVIDDNDDITPWACRLDAYGSFYGIELSTTEGSVFMGGAHEETMAEISSLKSDLKKVNKSLN